MASKHYARAFANLATEVTKKDIAFLVGEKGVVKVTLKDSKKE